MNLFYIIGFVFLIFIILGVVFKKTKSVKTNDLSFDVVSFVQAFGGYKNIICSHATLSKISVEVKDLDVVNVCDIEKCGASGVVITGNKVIAILGSQSKMIQEAMESK